MHNHASAKLGPAARFALTEAIANGTSQKAAAAPFCVAPATAYRRWRRRLEASLRQLRAPRGELCNYPINHFGGFLGRDFDAVVADQVEFLSRHLFATPTRGVRRGNGR